MNVVGILSAMVVIGFVGLFVGLFLGIAAIKFKVEVDEVEEKILYALPGNNCGGCGFPGCAGLAAAIAKGEAPVNSCPVGGDDVAKEIANIIGVESASSVKMIASVACGGTCDKTTQDYEYYGIEDCRMLSFVPNHGAKTCNYGCLGYGSCVKACPFHAITVENGLAIVDKDRCKACRKCIDVCPRKLFELVPYESKYKVSCSSKDKGVVTKKVCEVGCIACGLCKKVCPAEAITVEEFHAYINQEKCIGCGACEEKCPKKTISKTL